jgi:cytochrome c553
VWKLAAAFALLAAPAAAQDLSTPGARAYYAHGCYGCHGFDGKGRQPLRTATSGILQSEEVFITFLRMRADQNPLLPSTAMPSYPESALSDADARAIYAHILGIQSDDPAAEEIPVFRAMLEEAEGS